MVKRKTTKPKKPSKTLVSKINEYNRINEQANKKLSTKRNAIIKQAKKEGIPISMR